MDLAVSRPRTTGVIFSSSLPFISVVVLRTHEATMSGIQNDHLRNYSELQPEIRNEAGGCRWGAGGEVATVLQQLSERCPTAIPHQNENNWNFLLIKPTKFFLSGFSWGHSARLIGCSVVPATWSRLFFSVWITDDKSVWKCYGVINGLIVLLLDAVTNTAVCHMVKYLFSSLLCVAGVYIPPGAATGPGTGFFPGIRPDLDTVGNWSDYSIYLSFCSGYV